MIRFDVPGRPQPRGSKRAFLLKTGRTIVTDDNPKSKSWMEVIQVTALNAMNEDGRGTWRAKLLDGPIRLEVAFYFARPKGHFGKRGLKPSAPVHHTTRPDTTKLLRGLEDALKGICWRDDSQVCSQTATKEYGDYNHSVVTIVELPEIGLRDGAVELEEQA